MSKGTKKRGREGEGAGFDGSSSDDPGIRLHWLQRCVDDQVRLPMMSLLKTFHSLTSIPLAPHPLPISSNRMPCHTCLVEPDQRGHPGRGQLKRTEPAKITLVAVTRKSGESNFQVRWTDSTTTRSSDTALDDHPGPRSRTIWLGGLPKRYQTLPWCTGAPMRRLTIVARTQISLSFLVKRVAARMRFSARNARNCLPRHSIAL